MADKERKPKLEFAPNVEEFVTLNADAPYFDVGEYGTWCLMAVEHKGKEKTWFPPYHVGIYLKDNCSNGEQISVLKSIGAGDKGARWFINGIEAPFVRDPEKEEKPEPKAPDNPFPHEEDIEGEPDEAVASSKTTKRPDYQPPSGRHVLSVAEYIEYMREFHKAALGLETDPQARAALVNTAMIAMTNHKVE